MPPKVVGRSEALRIAKEALMGRVATRSDEVTSSTTPRVKRQLHLPDSASSSTPGSGASSSSVPQLDTQLRHKLDASKRHSVQLRLKRFERRGCKLWMRMPRLIWQRPSSYHQFLLNQKLG